ncbi:DUF1707 domain-containing protein [Frankia sp. AgB32]|uniref:DUF1707 SHOCT-like domain-containing protein n=1 Tax=Frankia sp. AgB32 TaxID=631119 RepID=UPI00200F18BE|nr:DUF1707 domain-containing protein [Frankia sp. AgB32]MCK9898179.1 DUF1707 domain-containing protein [Frankia sp. AgB32]
MTAANPDPTPPPALRVSDSEREEVARVLREALAEGRLTFAEFDGRVGAAYAARTRDDFAPLTADLPVQPALSPATGEVVAAAAGAPAAVTAAGPARPVRAEVDSTVAVLSGHERKGRWRPSRHTRAVAVLGGCVLDLREIAFPTEPITITAVAVLGGIEIIVPEGVDVEVTGTSVLGGRTVRIAAVPQRPTTPVVRVRAVAVLGGIDVRSEPPPGAHPAVESKNQPKKL